MRKIFLCFDKQEPGRARQKFLATTYNFFSALYILAFIGGAGTLHLTSPSKVILYQSLAPVL